MIFLSKAKTSSKKPLDKIGTKGFMNVASSNPAELAEQNSSGSSKRERNIAFEASSSKKDDKKRRHN